MRRTPKALESDIMLRILNGEQYASISAQTGVAVSTIKKIKKRYWEAYEATEKVKVWSVFDEMNRIYYKSLDFIERRLDDHQLDKRPLSINELLAISKTMHEQKVINSPPKPKDMQKVQYVQKYL